jgi:hypothetical protein
VIVDDLNIFRSWLIVAPNETYPVLLIDPNAELSVSIPSQSLQAIAWQLAKFIKARGRIKDFKPFVGLFRKAMEFANKIASSKGVCPFVPIALDHHIILRE